MGAGTELVPESLAECHTDIDAQCAGAAEKPVIERLWEVECDSQYTAFVMRQNDL